MKRTETFTTTFFGGSTRTSEAYTLDDGKTWYWVSNDAPCPLDACKAEGIPCDPVAQKAAIEDHSTKFLTEYREFRKANSHSPEEIAEMRAAFGPGKKVVDCITGEEIQL